MSQDRWSAVASILAALVVVLASNKQWWTISFNGHMVTRLWAQRMLTMVSGGLITGLVLLFLPTPGKAWPVFAGGMLISLVVAWPLGRWVHDRAVVRFKQRHPDDPPLAGRSY